jgi:hypothetical protein
MNSNYCTYLTTYKGNKLPPFYIGYTTVKNIQKGYRGSVASKKYKETWLLELKQNPEMFNTKIISLHNSKEEAKQKEIKLQKSLNVIKNEMYINKAIGHHYDNTGNKHSEETKKRLSIMRIGKPSKRKGIKTPGIGGVKKGNIPWNKGLKGDYKISEEHKNNISNSMKRHVEKHGVWNKGIQTGPKKTRGIYKWYHDPKTNDRGMYCKGQQPQNWIQGLNISKKGKVWYHDPSDITKTVFVYENQQPSGWIRGRGITGKRKKESKP